MVVYDPARYGEYPPGELLQAAARGHVGLDQRLLRSILARGEEAVQAALEFSRQENAEDPVHIDFVLVDLFRHWKTPEAAGYLVELAAVEHDDVSDELVHALAAIGEPAVAPLLELYEELGEEDGGEIAFLLAGLRVRDPRILEALIERLEYSASDGALSLGLYGDPAARPTLEAMLAEIPESDPELRQELKFALDQLGDLPPETLEPFDPLAEYPERAIPPVDELNAEERLALLGAPDPEARAAAAYSFFNAEVDPKTRRRLIELAQSDPSPEVRARGWMSLAGETEDAKIREEMMAVAGDASRDPVERGGALVGLHACADQDAVKSVVEALYAEGGSLRARALETMWRSLWRPFASYFPEHLDDPDIKIRRQALRGAAYFELTHHIDKIAPYFDSEDSDLREDALFAYAMAMPGEVTRGRVRGMLRKVDELAGGLTRQEAELVMFALDERLQLHGLPPVFADNTPEVEPEPAPPPPPAKVGRNDPCPCGSGKKYKKCHGA